MTATRDQALDAARALGYNPDTDGILSIYADPNQIIVRRMDKSAAGWAIVEDVTILNPNHAPPRQRADGDLGPLSTGGWNISGECSSGNHAECAGSPCQCRDLAHGATGDPHE